MRLRDKYPYYIHLPKNCENIYVFGKFSIVKQESSLFENRKDSNTIRSSKPFIIKITYNGKTRELESKKEKDIDLEKYGIYI